jgi:hypothetical protein
MNLVTQFSIRVQVPSSWCKSDSVSPRPATGPQRSEAGINGGAWQPQSGYPVQQASRGSASKGALSHRERQPAQEADALEPKRHRIRRRQPSTLTGLHCRRNPVESTALRMQTMETGNGVTPYVLSERTTGAGANRMAYGEGFLKKPRPGVMPRIS